MSRLAWVRPDKNNLPPIGCKILVKYKHGIISAYWDYERYAKDGTFVFSTYVWQDIHGYIEEFISMDAFNSVFVKENIKNDPT